MKNKIDTSFEYARTRITLSDSEKGRHRAALVDFMESRPAQSPIRSPFSAWLSAPALRFAAVVLLFIVVGSGTTYAAEGSLPGDVLYPVKIAVTEPLREALAVTPDQKADVENKIVATRLTELAQLAVQRRDLDPQTLAHLQDSLGSHIDAAQEAVQVLAAQGDSVAALQANSDLSATLDAGSDILTSVSDANPASAPSLGAITSDVTDAQDETDTSAQALTSAVASSTDSAEIADSSTSIRQDILDGLDALRAVLAHPTASIDESDQAVIADGIAKIEAALAQADSASAAGDDADALIRYTSASQQVTTLQALVTADENLRTVDVIGTDASSTDQ